MLVSAGSPCNLGEMRVFPSIPAAIVTGAVVMPAFILGCQFIEQTFLSDALSLLWAVFAFFVPILVSTCDLRYIVKGWREDGFFRIKVSREDFRQFYIPAWIRIAVLFASTGLAVIVFRSLGLDL